MAGLTICHINIVSLCTNLDKLEEFLCKFPEMPDIICLSETRTNQHNFVGVNMLGYSYNSNNSQTKAGSTGVYVINSLKCTENLNLRMKLTGCGNIWVEILLSSKILLRVGSLYRYSRQNCETFENAFHNNIQFLQGKLYVILGDFNINYGEFKVDSKIKRYVNDISSLGCEQLIACPTRVSSSEESILDHMYVDNCTLNNVNTTAVIEHDISDHAPIVTAFQLVTDRKKIARPLVRKYPNQNPENFLINLGKNLRSSAAEQQNDISELMKIMSSSVAMGGGGAIAPPPQLACQPKCIYKEKYHAFSSSETVFCAGMD